MDTADVLKKLEVEADKLEALSNNQINKAKWYMTFIAMICIPAAGWAYYQAGSSFLFWLQILLISLWVVSATKMSMDIKKARNCILITRNNILIAKAEKEKIDSLLANQKSPKLAHPLPAITSRV